jgi:uncharacterized OB-fold protein
MHNLTHKKMDLMDKKMKYILLLIDTIGGGICSPLHQAIFYKLRSMSPEEALEAAKNKNNFLREITSEGYVKTREILTKIKEKTEDPEKKKEYKVAIDELDGVFNLLSTIGENSDPKHVQKIMENVVLSLGKMREKGLDISIEGLDPF